MHVTRIRMHTDQQTNFQYMVSGIAGNKVPFHRPKAHIIRKWLQHRGIHFVSSSRRTQIQCHVCSLCYSDVTESTNHNVNQFTPRVGTFKTKVVSPREKIQVIHA